MLERRLLDRARERFEPAPIVCRFNAWTNDDAPRLSTALAAAVAREVDRRRPLWRRLVNALPSAMLDPEERHRRRLWLGGGSLLVVLAGGVVPSLRRALPGTVELSDVTLRALGQSIGDRQTAWMLLGVAVALVARNLFAAARAVAAFVDEPRSATATGSAEQIADQLGGLIHQATRRRHWWRRGGPPTRLIIFVDDLERCRPPRALEVCEVASQLLRHEDVVTVLIADMSAVAESAQRRYTDVVNQDTGAADLPYGIRYLQKIVQIQFTIPVATPEGIYRLLAASPPASPAGPAGQAVEATGLAVPDEPMDMEELDLPTPVDEGDHAVVRPRLRAWMRRRWNQLALPSPDDLLKWILEAVGIVFLLGYASPLPTAVIVGTTAGLAALGGLVTVAYTLLLRYWTRKVQRQRRAFDEALSHVETSKSRRPGWTLANDARRLTRAAVDRLSRGDDGAAWPGRSREDAVGLARQRVQEYLSYASPLGRRAHEQMCRFAPPVPRDAKRMLNHLRLAIAVASRTDLLGGEPPMEPEHLANWVVLRERWPELAAAVQADPALLDRMEATKDVARLRALGELQEHRIGAPEALYELVTGEFRLSAHLSRLLTFAPAAPAPYPHASPNGA
jgi:hypothetical protein